MPNISYVCPTCKGTGGVGYPGQSLELTGRIEAIQQLVDDTKHAYAQYEYAGMHKNRFAQIVKQRMEDITGELHKMKEL